MPTTSLLGADQPVSGLLLQVGNASSPETFQTIANVSDFSLPVVANTVDVTNVGDYWHRRAPTLLDMVKITFKIFWIMEEPTHHNSINGGSIGAGLRYLLVNKLLRDWQAIYPDGNESTDAWPAFVTSFAITGKVGGVFEASIELSNSGQPSLV